MFYYNIIFLYVSFLSVIVFRSGKNLQPLSLRVISGGKSDQVGTSGSQNQK